MKKRYWIGTGGLATAAALIAFLERAQPLVETYATQGTRERVEKAEQSLEAVTVRLAQLDQAVSQLSADQAKRDNDQLKLLKAIARKTGAVVPKKATPEPELELDPDE